MSLYERFAKDLDDSLFNSIYDDLFALATREQRSIWDGSKRRRDYYVGENQEMLTEFCIGRASLGQVMDFINLNKALETPLVH